MRVNSNSNQLLLFNIYISKKPGLCITNKYFYNNLCWDEIILPDGTKGFVANKYLSY